MATMKAKTRQGFRNNVNRITESLIQRNEELILLIVKLRQDNQDLKKQVHDLNRRIFFDRLCVHNQETQTELSQEDNLFPLSVDLISGKEKYRDIAVNLDHKFDEEGLLKAKATLHKRILNQPNSIGKEIVVSQIQHALTTSKRDPNAENMDPMTQGLVQEFDNIDIKSNSIFTPIQHENNGMGDSNSNTENRNTFQVQNDTTKKISPAQERVTQRLVERCLKESTPFPKSRESRRIKKPVSYREPSLVVKVRKGFQFFKFET